MKLTAWFRKDDTLVDLHQRDGGGGAKGERGGGRVTDMCCYTIEHCYN